MLRPAPASKDEARAVLKQYREQLPRPEKERKDRLIETVFTDWSFYKKAEVLFVYVSLADEIDTTGIITRALAAGKKVAVPYFSKHSPDMAFYYIKSPRDLTGKAFGVPLPAPDPDRLAVPTDDTLCVTPGFCFDLAGHRVGYGKGYYDRFFANFTGIKTGFCYQDCLYDKLPYGRFDQAVEYIITETGIIQSAIR